MYRFLLSASACPTYLLHCRGTHDETRTRIALYKDRHGKETERTETYTEVVEDFDFFVDIGQNVPARPGVIHWSVSDSEPAYRGSMVREVELEPTEELIYGAHRRTATNSEIKMFQTWADERRRRGLPPWAPREQWLEYGNSIPLHTDGGLRSSKTLRSWADEYCASKKYLKEFTYEKVSTLDCSITDRCSNAILLTTGDLRVEYRCPNVCHPRHNCLYILWRQNFYFFRILGS